MIESVTYDPPAGLIGQPTWNAGLLKVEVVARFHEPGTLIP